MTNVAPVQPPRIEIQLKGMNRNFLHERRHGMYTASAKLRVAYDLGHFDITVQIPRRMKSAEEFKELLRGEIEALADGLKAAASEIDLRSLASLFSSGHDIP